MLITGVTRSVPLAVLYSSTHNAKVIECLIRRQRWKEFLES